MKTFKRLDFYIQVLMIPAGIVYALVSTFYAHEPDAFIYPYFFVGGWQVLSCIIHGIFKGYYPVRDRNRYVRTIMIVLSMGIFPLVLILIGFETLANFLIIYLFLLLFLSPFLAIWYAVICYKETKMLKDKEFGQLK